MRRGLLTIVDLAGSERVSKSGSDGQRLREVRPCDRKRIIGFNSFARRPRKLIVHFVPLETALLHWLNGRTRRDTFLLGIPN